MKVGARYFDGKTAGSEACELTVLGSQLELQTASYHRVSHISDVDVISPVGGTTWRIEWPDDASAQFDDAAFGNKLERLAGESGFVRKLEQRWHWAIVALVVTVIGSWAMLTYGIPAGARYVAMTTPDRIMGQLGDESLSLLDRVLFSPSQLDNESRERVEGLYKNILANKAPNESYRLYFRSSNIGPNAFAIPGGVIVMTDELVELAEHDDELAAVLAHEVGHLEHRHSLRILLQDSASAMFIAGLTGDLTSITALSASVPTVLMQAKYSREFEREADSYAFDYMEVRGMDTDALSRLLQRIEETGPDGGSQPSSWFSSHPASEERTRD